MVFMRDFVQCMISWWYSGDVKRGFWWCYYNICMLKRFIAFVSYSFSTCSSAFFEVMGPTIIPWHWDMVYQNILVSSQYDLTILFILYSGRPILKWVLGHIPPGILGIKLLIYEN